jgi:hypothetical protein
MARAQDAEAAADEAGFVRLIGVVHAQHVELSARNYTPATSTLFEPDARITDYVPKDHLYQGSSRCPFPPFPSPSPPTFHLRALPDPHAPHAGRCLDENHALCILVDNPYVVQHEHLPWTTSSHGHRLHAAAQKIHELLGRPLDAAFLQPWLGFCAKATPEQRLHLILRLGANGAVEEGLDLRLLQTLLVAAGEQSPSTPPREVICHLLLDRTASDWGQNPDSLQPVADLCSATAAAGWHLTLGVVSGHHLACPGDASWMGLRQVLREMRTPVSAPAPPSAGALGLLRSLRRLAQEEQHLDRLAPRQHAARALQENDLCLLYTLDTHAFRQLYVALHNPKVGIGPELPAARGPVTLI